jgi:hypothetical protein
MMVYVAGFSISGDDDTGHSELLKRFSFATEKSTNSASEIEDRAISAAGAVDCG